LRNTKLRNESSDVCVGVAQGVEDPPPGRISNHCERVHVSI
jgi:hypothetical protein